MRKIIEWLMPSKKAARLKREADYQAAQWILAWGDHQ